MAGAITADAASTPVESRPPRWSREVARFDRIVLAGTVAVAVLTLWHSSAPVVSGPCHRFAGLGFD